MPQSTSNSESGAPSPETQYHMPPMNRSASPPNVDFNNNPNNNDMFLRHAHLSHHIDPHQNSESLFAQSGSHSLYNSNNNFQLLPDYLSDSDNPSVKQQPAGNKSQNDFGARSFRPSLSALNGVGSAHAPNTSAGSAPPSSFRMRQGNPSSAGSQSQSFGGTSEPFGPHQLLGIQHQLSQQSQGSSISAFESRSIDFGGSPSLGGKVQQQFALDPFLQSHPTKAQLHDSFHPLSHTTSGTQVSYLNSMHLQSQTPYGPHLQSNGGTAGGPASNTRGIGSAGQINVDPQGVNSGQQEEISTIFVVGFPDDMQVRHHPSFLARALPISFQEREFQNMFTFSPGFEAATLKIPNKEYTAYGSSSGPTSNTPSGIPLRGSSSYSSYLNSGSNDPYNIVTVNQGGVVVDNGRDGPATSWPPLAVPLTDEAGHFQGPGLAGQPRKQIIGFAKFRTRQEALDARDMLQGRRVDIEKGAVLKAEMAKKNLHTKRGVGIGSTGSGSGSLSLGNGMNALGGLNGGVGGSLGNHGVNPDSLAGLAAGLNLNSNVGMGAFAALGGAESLAARERELNALGAMGFNNLGGWREGRLGDNSDDERERDRERERRREALGAMGLNLGIGTRGARERALADEEERERERLRRRDAKQPQSDAARILGLSTGSVNAFGNGEAGGTGPSPLLGNEYGGIIAQTSNRDEGRQSSSIANNGREASVGPWDQPALRDRDARGYGGAPSLYRKGTAAPARPPSSQDGSSPHPAPIFSPSHEDEGMLPAHRSGAMRLMQSFVSAVDEPVHSQVARPSMPSSTTSSVGVTPDADGPVNLAVSTSGQVSTGSTSPQLPSPASHSGSAVSSSGGGLVSSSSGGANASGGSGPRNALIDQNPPINTLYVGNLPTGPVGGGYPAGYLEDSLRDLFSRRPGYRKLCFRQKSNGPMCFVEFEDVHYATKTLNELYGNTLGGLVKNGGIRLSYSKNPLGVRTPTSAGTGSSLQQQQVNAQSGVTSLFAVEGLQVRPGFDPEPGSIGLRRDNSSAASPQPTAFGYSRSPPPPRFVSPPSSSGTFSTSVTTFPRGSTSFALSLGGSGGGASFSPFGLPLSSPPAHPSNLPSSHSMIPDHVSSESALAHSQAQHFPHRALSPSSTTLEAARAG
ncbi:hypothetical protein F5I97DRAFT_843495 [Phlebopus sp. FC_14]|nr:hypothetical protein F5I97DRAFT_843495 [Phlebopus sp. FC_14]